MAWGPHVMVGNEKGNGDNEGGWSLTRLRSVVDNG